MRKLNLISTSLMIMIFMLRLSVPAQAYADTLEVLPTYHDFGDVEVGTTVTTIISMTNINGSDVEIYGLGFQTGGSADFSLASSPPVPFVVVPSETVEVEVSFTPSAAGYVTAVLEIESTDFLTSVHEVFFGGVGVYAQSEPVTIQAIQEFYDASIVAGTLDGTGASDWAKISRQKVFRFLLVAAGTLIEDGYTGWACHVLEPAYIRSDGMSSPNDFVDGEARAKINSMIGQLMADMGCE